MTSNDLPTPYHARASSTYTTFSAFKAFDGGVGVVQYWQSDATKTGWIGLDMGSGNAYIIGSYAIQNNSIPEPARMPKDWTLQGSNNTTDFTDGDWNILDTVTNESSWGNAEIRTYTCDVATTAYRFFKVVVTANNGGVVLMIGELYMYEAPTAGHYPIPYTVHP
jgi:hypothetical protein